MKRHLPRRSGSGQRRVLMPWRGRFKKYPHPLSMQAVAFRRRLKELHEKAEKEKQDA